MKNPVFALETEAKLGTAALSKTNSIYNSRSNNKLIILARDYILESFYKFLNLYMCTTNLNASAPLESNTNF